MNTGENTEIRDAFEEIVIREKELTPIEYFELGYEACKRTKDKPLTWESVINNTNGKEKEEN